MVFIYKMVYTQNCCTSKNSLTFFFFFFFFFFLLFLGASFELPGNLQQLEEIFGEDACVYTGFYLYY